MGVTHWTGEKFHGYLKETLELEVGYRAVMRWLAEKDFRPKGPAPGSTAKTRSCETPSRSS